MFFPPTHAGGITSASLPAGKPVASLRHSFPLLLELYVFEEQHQSHLPEPACRNSWQQSPSGPAGIVIPDASAPFFLWWVCSSQHTVHMLQPQRLLCQGCAFHTCFTGTGLQPCFVNELLFLWLETLALRLPQQYKQGPHKVCCLLLAAGDSTGRSCEFCFWSELLLQCSTLNFEYRNYMEWPDPRYIPVLSGTLFAIMFFPTAVKKMPFAGSWLGGEGKNCSTLVLSP